MSGSSSPSPDKSDKTGHVRVCPGMSETGQTGHTPLGVSVSVRHPIAHHHSREALIHTGSNETGISRRLPNSEEPFYV